MSYTQKKFVEENAKEGARNVSAKQVIQAEKFEQIEVKTYGI